MPWSSVGTLSPSLAWQAFPQDVINTTTLRISQTWGVDRPVGAALLGQYFPSPGGIAKIYKIYAIDPYPRIIEFPIPAAFQQQNLLLYTPMLKLGRFPHMGLDDWMIQVEAFY